MAAAGARSWAVRPDTGGLKRQGFTRQQTKNVSYTEITDVFPRETPRRQAAPSDPEESADIPSLEFPRSRGVCGESPPSSVLCRLSPLNYKPSACCGQSPAGTSVHPWGPSSYPPPLKKSRQAQLGTL